RVAADTEDLESPVLRDECLAGSGRGHYGHSRRDLPSRAGEMRFGSRILQRSREMTYRPILVLTAVASFGAHPACAYAINTHRDMSARALASSVLYQDPSILQDLGLGEISTQTFPDGSGQTINLLVQDGAQFEDDPPRPAAHFYDPVNNRPLTV